MDAYRVAPGTTVDLSTYDPGETSSFAGEKKAGRRHLKHLRSRLAELQRLLWADDRHKLLVVLQAMDTGGKDGTIRKVFEGVNPQGVHVANFKAPTTKELAHDYLWRVHRHTPGNGLGLSLVSAVAKLHDATISLEDNEPGARVVIAFP